MIRLPENFETFDEAKKRGFIKIMDMKRKAGKRLLVFSVLLHLSNSYWPQALSMSVSAVPEKTVSPLPNSIFQRICVPWSSPVTAWQHRIPVRIFISQTWFLPRRHATARKKCMNWWDSWNQRISCSSRRMFLPVYPKKCGLWKFTGPKRPSRRC